MNLLIQLRHLDGAVFKRLEHIEKQGGFHSIGTKICGALVTASEPQSNAPQLVFELVIKSHVFEPNSVIPSRVCLMAKITPFVEDGIRRCRFGAYSLGKENGVVGESCPQCNDILESAKKTSAPADIEPQLKETFVRIQDDIFAELTKMSSNKKLFGSIHTIIGSFVEKHRIRYRLEFQGWLRTPKSATWLAQKTWLGSFEYSASRKKPFEIISHQQLGLAPCPTCRGLGTVGWRTK